MIYLTEGYTKDKVIRLLKQDWIYYMRDTYTTAEARKRADDMYDNLAPGDGKGYSSSLISENEIDEVVEFANSLHFPITAYRGLCVKNEKDIKTGTRVGTSWSIDPNFIKNQTHLLEFNYVLVGEFDEQDINMPSTLRHYLDYSLKNPRRPHFRTREMEITIKRRREPKNLRIVPIEDFTEQY